jgi:hypothetical protein
MWNYFKLQIVLIYMIVLIALYSQFILHPSNRFFKSTIPFNNNRTRIKANKGTNTQSNIGIHIQCRLVKQQDEYLEWIARLNETLG